jgi:nucleotide-binding universal stress UspA family protein
VAEKSVFHHVVYATDWSLLSETVLKSLLDFKEVIEMLEIVSVIHKRLSIREMRNLKERLVETRKIFLDEGIDAEAHVYAGKPSEEIMLAARDYDATAIVMGTSRKSPLQEIFSGSCSYRVAEEAAIPVMVIGPPAPV